ncbi:MAG TPA: AAA family ATPase [Cyanophyceae cyanobacterium]
MTTINADNTNKQIHTPNHTQLWVSKLPSHPEVKAFFQLMQPSDEPLPGSHYIALEKEEQARDVYYQIKAIYPDANIGLIPLNEPFPFWFNSQKADLNSIFANSQCYELWTRDRNEKSLGMAEAKPIAEVILKATLPDSERKIELDELRKRCGKSDYAWGRFIASLEAELQAVHASADSQPKTSKEERLKLDISAWLRTTDPFKQEVERAQIQSTYRITNKTFNRLCNVLKEAESRSAKPIRGLTLKELYNTETQALSWLVPGYVPDKASILLSGLPGTCKSLLTFDLAYAVVTGGTFLGEQCRKGKVLILNSDQPLNITASYLADRGFDEDNPNILVVGQGSVTSSWTIHEIELLQRMMAEFQPDLVIADSIRTTICYPLGLEEKSEQVGHWMKEVERVVCQRASLIWVHHDNKDKELKGVSRASGSTAIPGNVSVHWRLEATNADPSNLSRRLSMPKTRGFESQTVDIQLNPDTGSFDYLGRVGESQQMAQERQSLANRIIELLSSRPGVGLEGKEIRDYFQSDSVYTVLARMVARGILNKRRSKTANAKLYSLPECDSLSAEPSPPRLSQEGVRCEAENVTQQPSQLPNTLPNTYLTPHLTPLLGSPLLGSSNVEPEPAQTVPNTSTLHKGGGVSECDSSSSKDDPFMNKTVRYIGNNALYKNAFENKNATVVKLSRRSSNWLNDELIVEAANGLSYAVARRELAIVH